MGILVIIIAAFLAYIGYNCINTIPSLLARGNYITAKDKSLIYLILTFIFAIMEFIGIFYLIAAILLLLAYLKYDTLIRQQYQTQPPI